MNVIKGKLEPFFETGTEGIIWSVYEDGKEGYDGLHCLDYGDYLTVYDPADSTKVIWEGNINLEWERNFRSYPMNPDYGQQEIGGYWVHGIQADVEPADWGTWFFKAYPATLVKAGFGHFYPLKSSTLAAYSWKGTGGLYDEGTAGDLIIKFKAGSYYSYKNIEPSVFWEFYNSESKGKYLAQHIKKKYDFEKLELPKPEEEKPHGSDVPLAWPFPMGPKP